jgi:adenylate cyclase
VSTPELEAAGLLAGLSGRERDERIEFATELLREGFSIEELKDAVSRGRLGLLPVDRVLQRGEARFTSPELAERSGMPLELLERLQRALGLPVLDVSETALSDADLEAAQAVGRFHGAGLEPEALVQISQVLGSTMARLGNTLREVVGEALLQPGDSERSVGLRWAHAVEELVPMLTPLLGYVLSVHLKEQIANDILSHEELASGRFEGVREVSVCFADLVGFTRLGERVPPGDLSRAERQLTELALDCAPAPVKLVKTIGDAVMLVSPEPRPLLDTALRLVERVEREGEAMPALRAGMASGDAVSQRGDWFGAPVNLASRLTDVARPGSVLATRELRDALHDEFAWSFAGRRRLRGLRRELELYRARLLS